MSVFNTFRNWLFIDYQCMFGKGSWSMFQYQVRHIKQCIPVGNPKATDQTVSQNQSRVVAAGPVSPVSTGPLFTSLVAWPGVANQRHCSADAPEAHNYHVETCEMTAHSATELFHVSSNNFPFLQANDQSHKLRLQRVWLQADKRTGSESDTS